MDINNFHIIVILLTIFTYIYLRSYKQTTPSNKSNLIYILLVPITLYTGYYYYYKNKNIPVVSDISNTLSVSNSSDLLSIPYPQSTTSS
jgi:hypothetical protein